MQLAIFATILTWLTEASDDTAVLLFQQQRQCAIPQLPTQLYFPAQGLLCPCGPSSTSAKLVCLSSVSTMSVVPQDKLMSGLYKKKYNATVPSILTSSSLR